MGAASRAASALRRHWDIPRFEPTADAPEGELMTIKKAAVALGVAPSTIHRLLNDGIIAGEQLTPGAPWRILLTDDLMARFNGEAGDGFIAMREAMRALGVSRQTVLQRVKRGELLGGPRHARQAKRTPYQGDSPPARALRSNLMNQGVLCSRVQEAANIGIEHPGHALAHDRRMERRQSLMRVSPRPEAVGEPEKVDFVDRAQHLADRALDDLVLQGRDAEWTPTAIGFREVDTPNRLWPVAPGVDPDTEVLEVGLRFCL